MESVLITFQFSERESLIQHGDKLPDVSIILNRKKQTIMWVFFESFSFGDYTNLLEHGKILTVVYLNPPGETVLKNGPFFNTDSLSFPASSTFLAGVCRSTKTEEDCTTKGKGEAKSSFTVPCLPILYFTSTPVILLQSCSGSRKCPAWSH